jgi:DNA-binding MarR family transcriptional regulator
MHIYRIKIHFLNSRRTFLRIDRKHVSYDDIIWGVPYLREDEGLTSVDYRALSEFRYQIRRYVAFSESAASVAGVEPQQHQLLLAVQGMPAGHKVRIGDLAERLQIRHHSAVELVGRMEAKGLVVRVPGETDRREVHVRLTPRGSRILRALTVLHREELRRAAPALVSTLRRLCEGSNAETTTSSPRRRRAGIGHDSASR